MEEDLPAPLRRQMRRGAEAQRRSSAGAHLLRMVRLTLPLKATATRLLRMQQRSTRPVACVCVCVCVVCVCTRAQVRACVCVRVHTLAPKKKPCSRPSTRQS
jgi:hypothetical protein